MGSTSRVWLVAGMLAATTSWAVPGASSADPEVVRGQVLQELIPGYEGRIRRADARRAAILAARAGTASVAEALPDLSDPADPAALRARLLRLDVSGVTRASQPADPVVDDARLQGRLARLHAAVDQAEAAAEEAERALIFDLIGVLRRAPSLASGSVRGASQPLRNARDAVLGADGGAPEDPGALERLAALDEALAAWTSRTRAAREALRRGETLSAAPDLARLGDDRLLSRDAIARLDLIRPALSEADRVAVDDAITAWNAAHPEIRGAPDAGVPMEDGALDAAMVEAVSARDAARAASGNPGLPPDVTQARREAAQAAAEEEATWWGARVDALLAVQGRRVAADEATRVEQEAARRAAEAAAVVEDDHPAHIVERESLDWTSRAWDAVSAWESSLAQERQARREGIDEVATQVEASLARARDRGWWSGGAGMDALYAQLRASMEQLRHGVSVQPVTADEGLEAAGPRPDGDRPTRLSTWESEAATLESEAARKRALDAVKAARLAIAGEAEPRVAAARIAQDERAARLEDLRRVKALRHALLAWVGSASADADRASWVTDLVAEVRTLPVQVRQLLRERADQFFGLGPVLLDGRRLTELVGSLFWSILGLAVWGLVRRRVPAEARRIASLESAGIRRPVQATEELTEAWAPLLRALLDLGVSLWLAALLGDDLPELSVALSAVAVHGGVRSVDAVIGLLTATPGMRREAPFVLTEEGAAILHRDVRRLGTWVVVRFIVNHTLTDLLYADVLGGLVTRLLDVVGLGLLLAVLWGWAPRLRERVTPMRNNPAWVTPWLRPSANAVFNGFVRPVRAVVLLAYLLVAAAWDVLQRRAAQGDAARTVVSLVDRLRRQNGTEAAEVPGEPLDAQWHGRLCGPAREADAVHPRTEAEEALAAHVAAWEREQRRGLVVLTGDRGDGKRTFLEGITRRFVQDKRVVARVQPDVRLSGQEDLMGWLAGSLGIAPVPPDLEGLRKAIMGLPSRVIVVRQAERTFVRRVGGFDALRALMDLCNATGGRHLWILSFHRPSWSYLTRLGPLVNTAVVRGVVDLAPMKPDELQALVMRRTSTAGLEVSFHRLEDTGPFGAPPQVERQRAVATYFRLLAEASGGCPQVALSLWADSLRRMEDGHCEVVIPPELAAPFPADLRSEDLLVLAALRLQETLTVAELEAQAGVEDGDVRGIVRGLAQRGLVVLEGERVSIDGRHIARVTKVLRRRHFLQWAA